MPTTIVLDGEHLRLEDIAAVARGGATVTLSAAARRGLERSRAVIEKILSSDQQVYGVNTGFGLLKDIRIPRDRLDALQLNLIRSHCAGVGPALPPEATRALMLLRAHVLARGYSGVRPAVGTLALLEAEELAAVADIAGACTLEALKGSHRAFDPRLHALRPHRGQVDSATNLRALLEGSAIARSHAECGRVQDSYSLRCMPQVHGSARDGMRFARSVLEVEVDAVTDNPIVFPGEGEVLSGGNFHGESPALALDCPAIAAAGLASIS